MLADCFVGDSCKQFGEVFLHLVGLYLRQVMLELQKEGEFEHYLAESQQLLAADCLDAQLEHDCLFEMEK